MQKDKEKIDKNIMPTASKWDWILFIIALLAILLHFILKGMHLDPFYSYPIENLVLLAAIFIGAIPIFIEIFLKMLEGDFGADLLAVLSIITGVVLGEYLAATLIVVMLSGGQALEAYAIRKASSVLHALAGRMPSIAHRRRDGQIEDIALADIQIGDEIVVFPHETTPVDGVVVEGSGSMDESYLTGEPYQQSKVPGTKVLSGAINGEAMIVVSAEKLPTDSRYAQIMKVMQEAEQRRPKIRRLGDQIGIIFAPLALIFALLAWYFTGDATRFLAVLVVATPCPLLIAIPITVISAISIAARHAIIIKDPTVLERLPTCRTAIFDKTGTLTYGKPELTEIFPAQDVVKNEILQLAASLERYSKHPLSSAILEACEEANLPLREVSHISEKSGQGLVGMIDGQEITITSRKMLMQTHPDMMSLLPQTMPGLECIVLKNSHYAATFHFRDVPRAEGKSFIHHLGPSHQFEKVMLVSGDRESEVSYLADVLDITERYASQSPEQKVKIVRAEAAKAPTLYMGDGINDAPALTAATVGIAFGQYSSVTAEAAGAVIMENTLAKVDELLHISIVMRTILLQSALGGMALSVIAMGFAAAGYITPVAGALLQEVIDIFAILNALRLSWNSRINTDLHDYLREEKK